LEIDDLVRSLRHIFAAHLAGEIAEGEFEVETPLPEEVGRLSVREVIPKAL
jgi:hypothetical protein